MKKVGDIVPTQSELMDEYIALLEKEVKVKESNKAFQPQPGPQTDFLNSTADITIYGGAAGGGKSYALLLSCLKDIDNPRYGAVIFRRTSTQIFGEGGLWDEATNLYRLKGGIGVQSPRATIKFPSRAKVTFAHLQYEDNVHDWDGSQIAVIAFDELCHFERSQFMYMMSRNRSNSGVKNRIIATCNPDADSFVARLIEWYIDENGFPIKERSNKIRYFIVLDDDFKWANSKQELVEQYGVKKEIIKSFTFIASSVYDNKIMMEKNPQYEANLNAQNTVQKGRLLYGNWKIKPSSGLYFRKDQVQVVPSIPCNLVKVVRAWDLAATIPTPKNPSPDATSGVLMGLLEDGRYIVLDNVWGQWQSSDVRTKIHATAIKDNTKYGKVNIHLPQDPAQAGKEQAQSYIALLSGFVVKAERMTGDKITRAEPFSSQWQAGNVLVLAGPWNGAYFTEMEAFPEGSHDDRVDSSSDSFTELQTGAKIHIVSPLSIEKESYWTA
ncbi:putative phage terminase large subunit-like protein [Sporomusaceae bacterium BoRhaA]|uniref:phage terminase large subunit n=1 Tax=Pelorhabdus rhamnosifermentans TaxID=2772457 RepID=UPI001FE3B533|nr:phage terminase large subunit [Pelorhabdus rhamnosifermentans]MBU2701170.1 putative phage terminase large subunit-like protein [Pelorhabdus rhamnosifermentans]